MIEILPGVYYNPALPWYQQDPVLIELAEQIMQETPVDSETETSGANSRMIWGLWNHTTTEGNFNMRVDVSYLYDISSPAFKTKSNQDQVTITQIS